MGYESTPDRNEINDSLKHFRNWGRWPNNPEAGAINLITPNKILQAAHLVKTGETVSLARPLAVEPAANNPNPVQYTLQKTNLPGGGGGVVDFIGISYHGPATTHIDALCHTWDQEGLWEGKDPENKITTSGVTWGSVEAWSSGIVTRGVLIDVPAYRNQPYVRFNDPVHGDELEKIVETLDFELEPGDALVIYCGREAFESETGELWSGSDERPGLHPSCLPFLRNHDVSTLVWDMTDMRPNGYEAPVTVHSAIYAYGIALVDSAALHELSMTCYKTGRYQFMLTINPLVIRGGTGSPVNPIAIF